MNPSKIYARLIDVDIDRQFVWYESAVREWIAQGCPEGVFVYRIPDTNVELVVNSDDMKIKYVMKIWRIRLC